MCAATLATTGAHADIDPNSGIDFARIRAVGNAPWPGDGTPDDRAIGRGRVNYEYSIGKFEVTTAQWVEFFNAAFDRPGGNQSPHLVPPDFWGASSATAQNPGGRRWQVLPGREMLPVGNIDWRMAAMYCNWLHNGKSSDLAAFESGAYDVSTFGYFGNIFTDQVTRSPGARYWIPSWDEWLKAAHYDPNKNGPGQGGWWKYSITSDTAPISGPPPSLAPGSLGQANAGGWAFPNLSPGDVPLGAYANVTSPWGLYDTAGGTSEWTEKVIQFTPQQQNDRLFEGSYWYSGPVVVDRIDVFGGTFPTRSIFSAGFRIASSIPSPSTAIMLLVSGGVLFRRRRI